MIKHGLIIVVLNGVVGLWIWGASAFGVSGDIEKGKTIYEQHCVACHGASGKGDGPMGQVLHPPATDFTSAQHKKKTDAELLGIIQNGVSGTAMSPWKNSLSKQDIQDVLAYIRSLG